MFILQGEEEEEQMTKPVYQILSDIYNISEGSDMRENANQIQVYMQNLTCTDLISIATVCSSFLVAAEREAERKYQLGDHASCRRHDDD